jgi:pyrroloquinoline quinone (PQQ) biosynthesis protein C
MAGESVAEGSLQYRERLLALYDILPFHEHPLWRAVLNNDLTLEQILRAEIQHYLRTRAGQSLRLSSLESAKRLSPKLWDVLLQTYLEECTAEKSGPSHLDLIKRLLLCGGLSETMLNAAQLSPGNAAAIALYRDITDRGAGCHMLGTGAVEFYYCKLSPTIYKAYVENYGMSPHQAETYAIHGPMDAEHASRAFSILDDAINLHGWPIVELSVRDAFVATSLHYDGMLQAALGKITYWNGEKR